jgi:hypothetical protein
MTIIDKGCWERGCPCYDYREDEGVEVIRKEWVGLTISQLDFLKMLFSNKVNEYLLNDIVCTVASMLKEKNT